MASATAAPVAAPHPLPDVPHPSLPLPAPSAPKPSRAAFAVVKPTLKYTHESPTLGEPAAPAFSSSTGPGGLSTNTSETYNLVVDVKGVVWRAKRIGFRDPPVEHQRVGRVDRSQLAEMRALARGAVGKSFHPGGDCPDRGGYGYIAHGLPGVPKGKLYLGGTHSCDARIDSKEGARVVEWLAAIAVRMLRRERERPFGLELPILTDLSDKGSQRAAADATVFELTRYKLGVVIDRSGDVYRYLAYPDEPRAMRRVGSVGRASLQRYQRLAELAVQEPAIDYEGSRTDWSSVAYYSETGGEAVLAKDCQGGARRQGASSDEVLAWLYAIEEQAQDVWEPRWPPR